MAKQITYSDTSRQAILRGVNQLADSGRWRSPFRTDADHDYELMSIIVPR